jgi:hypothetical protein
MKTHIEGRTPDLEPVPLVDHPPSAIASEAKEDQFSTINPFRNYTELHRFTPKIRTETTYEGHECRKSKRIPMHAKRSVPTLFPPLAPVHLSHLHRTTPIYTENKTDPNGGGAVSAMSLARNSV